MLQVFISSFLEQLSVLKSLNKLKFFLLHLSYLRFVIQSLLVLSHHFFLNLQASSILLIIQVSISLILRFLLLILNHLFYRAVFEVFLLFLHCHEIFLLSLFLLYIFYFVLHFALVAPLLLLNILFQLVFQRFVL